MPSRMRVAAERYGAKGHRVFPVAWSQKVPRIPKSECAFYQSLSPKAPWQKEGAGGFHTAPCDPRAIRTVWTIYDGRIGYAMPPTRVAVDVDDPKALDGLAAANPGLHESLMEVRARTAVVRTRRGEHIYMDVPEGVEVRQTHSAALLRIAADNPRHFLDLKVGSKGYTLLPPSPGYAWVRGSLDSVAVMPEDWVLALTVDSEPPRPPRPLTRLWMPGEPRPAATVDLRPSTFTRPLIPDDGEVYAAGVPRHPILRSVARAMRGDGADYEEIEARLLMLNETIFECPKEGWKVKMLARSTCERFERGR